MSEEEPSGDTERDKRMEARKAETQLKGALRLALDDAAYSRLNNVSISNKELYINCARYALAYNKKLGRKLTEEEIVKILKALKEQSQNETSISFQRK